MFAIPKDDQGNPLFPPKNRWVIRMFYGPNWDASVPPESQPGIGAHLVYWLEQMKNGNALLAGPYAKFDDAVVILGDGVTTYEEADAILKGDPWDRSQQTVSVIQGWLTNPLEQEVSP